MSRNRLRRAVAALAGAAVGASALATASAPAQAASPTRDQGVLVVGGASHCNIVGPPEDGCNSWRFMGPFYSELRAALVDPANFGPGGRVGKGQFVVSTARNVKITPEALAPLDVFVTAIPSGEYDDGEIAALRAFVAGGNALVLLNNQRSFGDATAVITGLQLRATRAFYAADSECGLAYAGDRAPGAPVAAVHPITAGPFTPVGDPALYHTVNVLQGPGGGALPAGVTPLYTYTATAQPMTLAATGPYGRPLPTSEAFNRLVVAAGGAPGLKLRNAITTAAAGAVTWEHQVLSTGPWIGLPADDVPALAAGVHKFRAVRGAGLQLSNEIEIEAKTGGPIVGDSSIVAYRDCPGNNNGGGRETIDNNLTGAVAAAIAPGVIGPGSGPVVITSDLDLMSNAYGTSWSSNRNFALNSFAWLMDRMLPDVPPVDQDTFFSTAPTRIYNSRNSTPIGEKEWRDVQVRGVFGIPADARAIVANVTAVDPTEAGFFAVRPAAATQAPVAASTHNFRRGENFANLVVVPIGVGGRISVYNEFGNTHVLVDVVGYTRPIASGSRLRTMAPDRVLDTRTGVGGPASKFGPATTRTVLVRGVAGVPADATAVVLNMTAANPDTTGSFLTVWASGAPQPDASVLNTIRNVNRPNLVVAPIGADGRVSVFNAFGTVDVLADVVGYFTTGGTGGSIVGLASTRIFNTREADAPAIQPGQTRTVQITGRGNVPASARTAILKVTVDQPTSNGGFLTVYPTGIAQPNVSNLNFDAGMAIPNIVVTQIGTGGQVSIFNAFGTATVLVDVLGYGT